MKLTITYTVLSLVNLIGFVIGVLALPAQVPIHFNWEMVADVVGSPWVYLALPAAAALISVALWVATLSKKEKNRKILLGVFSAIGAVLSVIGWVFFALASGVEVGEKVKFPVMLTIFLPLSLLMIYFGNCLPRIEHNFWLGIRTRATIKSETVWTKTHRLGGLLFFLAGLISAICTVVFCCIPKDLDIAALIVFLVTLGVSAVVTLVYSELLYKKEKSAPPAEEE